MVGLARGAARALIRIRVRGHFEFAAGPLESRRIEAAMNDSLTNPVRLNGIEARPDRRQRRLGAR